MLARDRELDTWIEGYVCFFGDFNVTTPQRRSSTHSLSQSHTHTLTHMTGQQWLLGQVVPNIFSGFANFLIRKWVARIF